MRGSRKGGALARTAMMSLVAFAAMAQTQIDLSTQTKKVDFSNASSTKPVQTGTTLPGTCAVGQMYFKSNAPAGTNLYACTSTNVWTAQAGIIGATADQLSGPFFCQDSGASGAYACSLSPAIGAYVSGTTYWFRANSANTGGATLNLNGLGAKTIVKQGNQPLAANDIRAGQWVMVTFDGTNLQMQSQTGNAPAGGSGGGLTAAGDVNYTMALTDRVVYHAAMTATRTDTLPAANSVSAGTTMCEIDKLGLLNSAVTLRVSPHGSDTINGGAAGPQLQTPFAGACFLSDGAGNWTVTDNAASIVSGVGVVCSLVSGVVQCGADTSVMLTRLQASTWGDVTVADTGSSGNTFAGCPAGVTPALTPYMEVELVPAHASLGGASTFNYCSTGAVGLYESDGVTNLSSGDISSGQKTAVWYDTNSHWRLKVKTNAGGSSGVASFSGDGGLITNNNATGGVTVSLATAGAHKYWGNNTGSAAAPGYDSITTGDLPGAGATTVNGQSCTLGSACTIPLSSINAQSGTYQVSSLDFSSYKTITVASGTFTITLAASTSQPANGLYINILNYGSGTVTVARSGQNINGGTASISLPPGSAAAPVSITIWSDGTNYFSSAIAGAVNASQVPANLRSRAVGMVFSGGGSTLSPGAIYYLTTPFACTISGWNLAVDAGTATVDIWKTATGTAIPTSGNSITASARPAISTGTALHSTTLTGWTTAVSANDVWGFNLESVSGATVVSIVVECDQ